MNFYFRNDAYVIQSFFTLYFLCYLVYVERKDKPLTCWSREVLVGLYKLGDILLHVVYIEHIVQIAVLVCNQVKDDMAIFLIGIDVMEDHKWVCIVLRAHSFPSLPIDQMDQCLCGDQNQQLLDYSGQLLKNVNEWMKYYFRW